MAARAKTEKTDPTFPEPQEWVHADGRTTFVATEREQFRAATEGFAPKDNKAPAKSE